MLTFEINQAPPTTEKIAAERMRLETAIQTLTHCYWLGYVATLLLVAAALWGVWQAGILSPEGTLLVVAGIGVVAVVGAVVDAFVGIVVGAVGIAVVGIVVGVGVGLCVGAGAFAFAAEWASTRLSGLRGQIAALGTLNDPAHQHRCETFAADCLADAQCESYRQQVAALGRSLVVAEADMAREWVDGAKDRQGKEESRRRREIACVLVSSPEPLDQEKLDQIRKTG